jgi:hypothetical protein
VANPADDARVGPHLRGRPVLAPVLGLELHNREEPAVGDVGDRKGVRIVLDPEQGVDAGVLYCATVAGSALPRKTLIGKNPGRSHPDARAFGNWA